MEDSHNPRYMTLRQTLSRELAAGRYPVGGRFPTEGDLCSRFAVSRHTIREALRGLEDAGLIARQPGAGTVVLATSPAAPFVQSVESLAHLVEYATETALEAPHIGMLQANAPLAEALGCAQGSRWLRIAGLRYLVREARPLCWTEVHIDARFAAVRDALPGASPVFALVAQRFGLTIMEVEQRVSAVPLPESLAALLDAVAGTPALLLRRRYFAKADMQPFEVSLSLFPGDRFAYSSRLRREISGEARTRSTHIKHGQ